MKSTTLLLLFCLLATLAWAATKAVPPLVTRVIFNEVPVLESTDATGRTIWTLKHPTWTGAVACYSNGHRQNPETDYYVAYNLVISVWAVGDKVICDYNYQQ